ncbi:MAG: sugar transferase [Fibrobacteria bacterium]|nr:sugar transferase [Fibrobacteria bacterium]
MPDKKIYYIFKRLTDILGALIGLFLFFLFLPIIALIIKLDSPGPVFFFQSRVGQYGTKFRFIKFRTMVVDAHLQQNELNMLNETQGLTFKMTSDPRVTRFGRFLRKTSIDETPQFWVVLLGDMSLIGPRPPLLTEVERYDQIQKVRLTVPQGITGLWQVRGRSRLKFDEMMDLDSYYALNASFWLDFKILFYTFPAVLFGRGAC